jgi:putative N6-adenine-specific DNA methylase
MSAQNAELFVVAQPGLEDLVEAEIRDWFPDLSTQREHGGVTFHAPLAEGLQANFCLRTATRILVRVASLRCRDFPKLFKFVSDVDWKSWIHPDVQMRVHASTRVSRLKIKRRIEETCQEAWQAYQKQQKVKVASDKTVDLYVRIHDDLCTLSLDTSGERLHKRGEKPLVGEAPLRESIAAALIQWVGRDFVQNKTIEVVDPMMGSGTILLEAVQRDKWIETRDFSLSEFVQQPSAKPELHVQRASIEKVIGFEQDKKTFQAAQKNLANLNCELHNQDLFKAKSLPASSATRCLMVNPPYGERLTVTEPLQGYYEKLFDACDVLAKPDIACFILPNKAVRGKFALPPGWKVLKKRPFLNGGIPVTVFVFGRSS